ncbi:hypothetical protein JQN58_25110 [Aneurinibacillus sp. BA2021]|nr:hypothetical protein [Aneurinibacillus sp. BA2021]
MHRGPGHVARHVQQVLRAELGEGALLRVGHPAAAAHERHRFVAERAGFGHGSRVAVGAPPPGPER